MYVYANTIVLFVLLVLLVMEEIRYRKFARVVEETREGLLALAHRLRSPLAALKKYHTFLRSHEFGSLSFSQQEALSKIEGAFGETVTLVERLLARSRIEETPLSSDKKISVDIVASCSAAIVAVTPEADRRSHRITFTAPKKKIFARIDPLLLHGILDELLINAIGYTRSTGKIRVDIKAGKTSATIGIHDNGIGISLSEKKYIFQKFFRGNAARTMAAGSGLGLAFAQSFTEASGGSIRFVSTEGKGSSFFVTLRRQKA